MPVWSLYCLFSMINTKLHFVGLLYHNMVKKSNTKYKFCKNVQNARVFFAAFLRQNVPSENKYFISVGKTLFLNMDFAAFSASFLLFEKFDMKKSWIFSSELADMRRENSVFCSFSVSKIRYIICMPFFEKCFAKITVSLWKKFMFSPLKFNCL